MKWLVDERYPEAEVIRVVLDNLNTHKPASLYEAFPPEEARRIVKKPEFHYTPKHGSWLDMAEIELSILQRQCLGRVSRMKKRSSGRLPPGKIKETKRKPRSIGDSLLRMHIKN